MTQWQNWLGLGAILLSMTATSVHAQSTLSLGQTPFDLATYREMKKADQAALGALLSTMHETVFYAQKSVGTPVICASPKPIPVADLIEMVDKEIAAPSNALNRAYAKNDHMAFIFVSALKKAAVCD
jgi:hypothetical protein